MLNLENRPDDEGTVFDTPTFTDQNLDLFTKVLLEVNLGLEVFLLRKFPVEKNSFFPLIKIKLDNERKLFHFRLLFLFGPYETIIIGFRPGCIPSTIPIAIKLLSPGMPLEHPLVKRGSHDRELGTLRNPHSFRLADLHRRVRELTSEGQDDARNDELHVVSFLALAVGLPAGCMSLFYQAEASVAQAH